MSDVLVIDGIDPARVLLDETRLAILERLAEPGSAASLEPQLGVPRQRLNYHLHELERTGLVVVEHERRRGSVRERSYRRSSASYAISTAALGPLGVRPDVVQDRFSSAYQIAVASQAVAELGALRASAAKADKAMPTLTMEVEVRFADPETRSAFAQELADVLAALVRRYHDDRSRTGRTYRFYLGAYPKPRSRA